MVVVRDFESFSFLALAQRDHSPAVVMARNEPERRTREAELLAGLLSSAHGEAGYPQFFPAGPYRFWADCDHRGSVTSALPGIRLGSTHFRRAKETAEAFRPRASIALLSQKRQNETRSTPPPPAEVQQLRKIAGMPRKFKQASPIKSDRTLSTLSVWLRGFHSCVGRAFFLCFIFNYIHASALCQSP